MTTLVLAGAAPAGAQAPPFRPGAAGIGDPYFPLAGNGGYDVRHYGLDITYTPATDVLAGVATISARATQDLSAFNLDFDGLTLRSLTVDGRPAAWTRANGELTVTPHRGLRRGTAFTVVARYDGVPQVIDDPNLGASGVFATDDGMVIVGQPEVASTWFPVNDHPLDKASFTTRITAPQGLESVSNGVLLSRSTRRGWTTTTWDAREPMAPYLATATVGEYDVKAYKSGGVKYWDALDPKLFTPPAAPRTGSRMALTQDGEPSYKRLTRSIAVPAGGATLGFQVTRDTEEGWDFFFVEARTAGAEDWTTLPDTGGHSSAETGALCSYAPELHPFLLHYLTPGEDDCTPTGTSGTWSGASGRSGGYEPWSIDLSAYAGRNVEVSLSSVNDQSVTLPGVFVDDVVVSTGEGTTSFEDDGNTLDGWVPGGPPAGSPANPSTWISGTAADLPPTAGDIATGSIAREPEIVGFLADTFGRYPFKASGGIVDSTDAFGIALENQTRPVYAQGFFTTPESGDSVVVHELAHQWYGDSLAVARWQDIWLNEGFATYAEWLWSEREGLGTAQENFDNLYGIFADDPDFWALPIGDPGPEHLFDTPVYVRGGMTLHALRKEVGDTAFFRILRTWAATKRGQNVTTPEFVTLAERISGRSLDTFFQTWLFTPVRPEVTPAPVRAKIAGPNLVVKRWLRR
ncbi:peptidase M1 membrane alanine aminopeptidase [Actinoplanes friuliensis DSM 7358]|uniref:Peptidase M1 membrane alanine aminopeptidase n=1 Tax=Actinoplanes friuliensis DSM 7358 TaxID=1246995 RepID=U5VYR5_9ACTN|nr:peptidase M1 membrane alanine aminopeptidase [Actinoplanes friuliensis DSM 7358]